MRNSLIDALEPAGLTLTQYTVMSILAERPGLSNAQLARRSLVSPQAMNQAMADPIARALVERTQDPDQGRILRLTLTEEGRRLLDMVEDAVDQAEAAVLSELSAAERKELLRLLTTVAEVEPRSGD